MTASQNGPSQPGPPIPIRPASSPRIAIIAGLVGTALISLALWVIISERRRAEEGEAWAFQRFGLADAVPNRLAKKFLDQDQDLVADPPAAEAARAPDVLVFSYIPDDRHPDPRKSWNSFMQRLQEAADLPVEYRVFDSVADQLKALEQGTLHVTALNTGSVPRAVNQCGFVPVSAKADAQGNWKISMKLIVPADSPVKSVSDLKRKYITFTNPSSFSGFKFGIVTLLNEFGMRPGRDYEYRFSTSHEHSIDGIVKHELEAALVASDLLETAYAQGRADRDQIREIYDSPPFPAAAFGYAHNLSPAIAEKIRGFLIDCDLSGTPLSVEPIGTGPGRLAATRYRDDWEAVRKVDDSIQGES